MAKIDLLKNKIVEGTFWLSLSSLFGKFFSAFAVILTAKYIGKENFGYFSTIQNTIIFLSVFSIFGIDISFTKYVSQYKDSKNKLSEVISFLLFSTFILVSTLSIIIFFFSENISENFLNDRSLYTYIVLMIPCLALISLNAIISGFFIGLEKFKSISIINTIGAISYLISVLIATSKFNLIGAFFAFSIYNLVLFLTNIFYCIKTFKEEEIKLIFSKSIFTEFKILTEFSLPSFLSSLIVAFTLWYPLSLITYTDNGYQENAIFNASNQIKNMTLIIPNALSSVLLPFFTSINKTSDLKKSLYNNLFYSLIISLVIFILTFFSSDLVDSVFSTFLTPTLL
ncbi:MAG: oligosaccharide flippase family protein, partial [Candidatus Sericytochromatia bacterium]